ncbi:MAG: DNA mismatch repair protein MutS, partial [Bacilli bacterium]|nr:DNA mismatch repair protein MutS [Bacilli bacterium]
SVVKIINNMNLYYSFYLNTDFEKYKEVYKLIDESISNDAPYVIKDGNVIKKGYSKELDELKNINLDSKNYILSLETKEKEKTGIKTLKVGYNKVFGYYIEVSKLQSELVKDEYGYIRKQTLSNAERYITQELKEKEALILRAEEKTLELEQKLFTEVRNKLKEYTNELQTLAKTLAELDMMLSFTKVSNDNKYVRPTLNDNGSINIKDGRHPVIETNLKVNYVSNDLKMSPDDSILLITGPNMSGKSTYMRQVALTAIMAQIGCFVPCKSADIPIFDQIFTRIGASDDIVSGQSTFMVEMMEVNNALQNATKNSLILFDEIGRGTATYDGMALAQAIIEYVHDKIGCKTLFSTHYHELTSLESSLSKLKNVHVSAEEVKGEVVFLHKVKQGAIDKSYGINVAKLAKINLDIILRATDILNKLQENENYDKDKLAPYNYVAPLVYDSKTEVEEEIINKLKHLNIYEMNPMDAMNLLNELKHKLN